jgi:hypothetical protein
MAAMIILGIRRIKKCNFFWAFAFLKEEGYLCYNSKGD